MNIVLSVAFLVVALAGIAFWNVFRKLVSRERVANFAAANLSESNPSKYRLMARLLDEDEFLYLSSQPGYTAELGKRFRTDRRRIFRRYLRSMQRDFSRLYLAAKLIALHAPEDRPDLGLALIKQRCLFAVAMLAIEYRLAFHLMGRRPVDVSGLVNALDALQFEVRQYMSTAKAEAA
ncbi:MAG: hypothetical protein ACRD8O_22430 [Bryobacteraceae bacterium]